MNKPQIELKDFSFTYDGCESPALKDVSLSVKEGEFILLTGPSGCGKTTLTRVLNGLIPDFFEGKAEGSARVCDLNIPDAETGDFSFHVGSVFQDPRSQFFTLHVKTEIPFPGENLGKEPNTLQESFLDATELFGLEPILNRSIFDLSSGEKQKVAIASVYVAGVEIFVLDEPSANLDGKSTEELKKVLKALQDAGHTVILSEHKLYYLKDLCDRVVLMKDGQIAEILTGSEFFKKDTAYLESFGLRETDLGRLSPKAFLQTPGTHTLSAGNLSFRYRGKTDLWKDCSFSVSGGQIIGILGENGSGKSTLIRTLMGLNKPRTGKIFIDGAYAGKQKRREQSFYVMQDVDYQLFAPSVFEECLMGGDHSEAEQEKAAAVLKAFGLESFRDRHPTALSGGQKQRLSIALSEMHAYPFLFFDEPTSGLDARNMRIVREELKTLARKGACIFIITHDYEFAADLFSALLVIEDGTVTFVDQESFKPEKLAGYFHIRGQSLT